MNTQVALKVGLFCAVAAVAIVAATGWARLRASGGPAFELSWYSIDGGGVSSSSGGDFELAGTVGQTDAGRMSGGEFTMTGGFWFEVVASDCNQDGVVNLTDYDDFEPCLSGPGGGPLPGGCNCFDFNRDGVVTLGDFATMQKMFNGPSGALATMP